MLDFVGPPEEMQKKVAAYLDKLKPQFEGTMLEYLACVPPQSRVKKCKLV